MLPEVVLDPRPLPLTARPAPLTRRISLALLPLLVTAASLAFQILIFALPSSVSASPSSAPSEPSTALSGPATSGLRADQAPGLTTSAQASALASAHARSSAASNVTWRSIAPDLEVAERPATPGFFSSSVVLVRSSLSQHRLGVIRAADFGMKQAEVRSLCRLAKASACINSNFFDEDGEPLGLVLSRGMVHHRLHSQGHTLTGILQITRQGPSIVSRQSYSGNGVVEAVQAGPRLIVDGAPTSDIRDLTRTGRSAVCIDKSGRVILLCASSGFRGLSFSELQNMLASPELDCQQALNFDGGGSAQIFVAPRSTTPDGSAVAIAVNGFDPVPVALGIFDEPGQ